MAISVSFKDGHFFNIKPLEKVSIEEQDFEHGIKSIKISNKQQLITENSTKLSSYSNKKLRFNQRRGRRNFLIKSSTNY